MFAAVQLSAMRLAALLVPAAALTLSAARMSGSVLMECQTSLQRMGSVGAGGLREENPGIFAKNKFFCMGMFPYC